MKIFLFNLMFIFIFVSAFQARTKYDLPFQARTKYDLPKGALIVESQTVKPGRRLILWMLNPQKNPREGADIYSCPDYTRGNFYHGKPQVSLINTKTQKVINTLPINDDDQGDGTFDIPYFIERHYYKVPVINAKKEGKPQILSLQDFNGDGKAYEFAMYDALACQGLNTALFGYSEKQDKVIQYPIELTTGGKTETIYWADYLFSKKPVLNGYWNFAIDYRGRGGSLDKYEIRYDKTKEKFVGSLASTASE